VDIELIEAARGGDRQAFVDAIRPRVDRLYAIALRILRDPDLADDTIQDAMVVAWRSLRGLRDSERFDAWLQRIVVNECLVQANRERRRQRDVRPMDLETPSTTDDTLTVIVRDQLERGFRRLSPNERAILVLHHYEGYAPGEIATVLGIPPGTARSRLFNAHRALRAALEAEARGALVEGGQA
jgi:RNA polymerase sigma-70 factor, ECF subfamily